MLDRIEMDVVDMSRVVNFIFDRIFPISALPDTAFALDFAAIGNRFNLLHGAGDIVLISRQRSG